MVKSTLVQSQIKGLKVWCINQSFPGDAKVGKEKLIKYKTAPMQVSQGLHESLLLKPRGDYFINQVL